MDPFDRRTAKRKVLLDLSVFKRCYVQGFLGEGDTLSIVPSIAGG